MAGSFHTQGREVPKNHVDMRAQTAHKTRWGGAIDVIVKNREHSMHNNIAGSDPIISANRARSKRHDHSDEALIEKVAAGNTLAMQVLFARHHARVYRFILRLIGKDALAEDLASEVFLTVGRKSSPVRGTLGGHHLAAGYRPLQSTRRAATPTRSTGR